MTDMDRPRVFSPTATERFLQCPYLWSLHRSGLQPSRLGKRDLSGILGTAFAASVGAFNSLRREGITPSKAQIAACGDIGVTIARNHLAECDEIGMVTDDSDLAQRNATEDRVRRAIRDYAAQDPIPPTWHIRDVELTMEEAGNARLDLGCESDLGGIVVDYKTKISWDSKWAAKDVAQWGDGEQRFHYSYFYGARIDRPVWQFAIILVVIEPRVRVHLFPFPNDPLVLSRWRESRQATWARMVEVREGRAVAEMAAKHWDNFGPCEMKRHCFDHQGDLNLTLLNDFILKPKKETP